MTTYTKMVQLIETAKTETEATEILNTLRIQVDFVAGRVLQPSPSKPEWRAQVFFEDCGHDLPLCDGCRRVSVPSSLLRQCAAA